MPSVNILAVDNIRNVALNKPVDAKAVYDYEKKSFFNQYYTVVIKASFCTIDLAGYKSGED